MKNALVETTDNLIDTIAQTQNYLGVSDLTQIETTHKLPNGKTLTDLITAYYDNNIQQVIQALPELSHLGLDSSVSEVIATLPKNSQERPHPLVGMNWQKLLYNY